MYALQLLKIAKARNIMTDREPSDQLRLVVADESDSAARSGERHGEKQGDVDMAAAERRMHSLHREGRATTRYLRIQEGSETAPGGQAMHSLRFTEQFKGLFSLAVKMTDTAGVDAIILLLDGPAEWSRLKSMAADAKVIVAADTAEQLEGAKESNLATLRLNMPESYYIRTTYAIGPGGRGRRSPGPRLERDYPLFRFRRRQHRFPEPD